MRVELDDLTRPAVVALIAEHMAHMHRLNPPEHVFALDLSRLRAPDVSFWTAWEGDDLLGCAALREMSATEGEVKSMRTPEARRRTGAGRALLAHLVGVARSRGYAVLRLETGSHPEYLPAQRLYGSFGFTHCGPFGSYVANDNSVFMELSLAA